MTIGERIKEKRLLKNYTLEKLAIEIGVTKSTVLKYENGTIAIPSDKIEKIAEALNVSPAYLMGWESPEEIPNSIPEAEFLSIPLYASISAGYGSCQDEFVEMLAVPGIKSNGSSYFAIIVKGDSMEPKIPDGSIVIIKKDIVIENGDIGAFGVNGESYVKQKRFINGKLILHSFNLAYESILVQPYDDFREYGKVVKVLIDL